MERTLSLPSILIPAIVFAGVATLAGTAAAQGGSRGVEPAEREIDVVCLRALDVRETQPVARAVLERDVEILAVRETNCFVIVGSQQVDRLRSLMRQLERRARARARRAPSAREAPCSPKR